MNRSAQLNCDIARRAGRLLLCLAGIASGTVIYGQTTESPSSERSEVATDSPKSSARQSDEISSGSLDKQLLADLLVRYTNEEREKEGLEKVEPDKRLQELARQHSTDMAQSGYFSHTTQRDDKPDMPFQKRVDLQELGYMSTGENISLQPIVAGKRIITRTSPTGESTRDVQRNRNTYEELARQTVDGWMKSPGHRKNILTPEFNLIGIGLAVGSREGSPSVWITQDFAQK